MFDVAADPGLKQVLAAVGVSAGGYLGHGGEAWVGALGTSRVVRVLHPGGDPHGIAARQALVDELHALGPPFALPRLITWDSIETDWGPRHFSIERRVAGKSVLAVLPDLEQADRNRLVVNYLESIHQLGQLDFRRDFYGDLLESLPSDQLVRHDRWTDWLENKVAYSLRRAGPDFGVIDTADLVEAMPAFDQPGRFIHLDGYPGNVMAVGTEVRAVIDIGAACAIGDPRLDVLAAAIYLSTPCITPTANHADYQACFEWIEDHGLTMWLEPTRRWLAAFWAGAIDDKTLHGWCRATLLGS